MTIITGNTYPVKEQIKALGGTWNKAAQGWNVPDDKAETARVIVAGAGPSTYTPRRYTPRTYHGHGRCEDAPCCGCCD